MLYNMKSVDESRVLYERFRVIIGELQEQGQRHSTVTVVLRSEPIGQTLGFPFSVDKNDPNFCREVKLLAPKVPKSVAMVVFSPFEFGH